MEIREITQRIEEHLREGAVLLCDESTTGSGEFSQYLNESLELQSLQLRQAVLSQGEDWLLLEGRALLFDQEVSARIEFSTEASEIQLRLHFGNQPDWEFPLDKADWFLLNGVLLDFGGCLGKNDIQGALSGDLHIGGLSFRASGTQSTSAAGWHISLTPEPSPSLRELLAAAGAWLGLELPVAFLPETPLKSMVFEYDSAEETWDHLQLAVTTSAGLMLSEHFGLRDLGFVLHRRGEFSSFTLLGGLQLGTSVLPVFLRFRDKAFDLGVDTDKEGCPLPSLSDVGLMLGVADCTSVFPAELVGGLRLKLTQLTVSLPYELNRLNRFSVGVATINEWDFFGIHGLSLEQVSLGFSTSGLTTPSTVEFALVGKLKISCFHISLGAIYSTQSGWTFRGALPPGERLELKAVVDAFAQALGISVSSLPIPDIAVYLAKVEFGLTDKHFSGEIGISAAMGEGTDILHKLLQINAQVKVTSELHGTVRGYSGLFQGSLLIAGNRFTVQYRFNKQAPSNEISVGWDAGVMGKVTLVQILNAFGVEDIPSVVAELDLGISKVSMRYQIDKKELEITIVSSHFETISLTVDDSGYKADLLLRDKLTLSLLPVVGTSLHLLDALAVERLELLASTADQPDRGTLSGAALLGQLCGQPFTLQVYHSAPQLPERVTTGAAPLAKWFELNKKIGIFELHRLGIGFQDGKIALLLDASLTMNPVVVDLLGLGLGIGLSDPSDVAFYLSGLGISFDNGVLSISGAFQKSTLGEAESYDGRLRIQFKDISITTVGSYNGDALLVYALLKAQLGGPPVFFVTGLAAGFGVNLELATPTIEQVPSYPLVAGALGKLGDDKLLSELKTKVTPQKGQNFLAVGIKFTSFQMVHSFALLTVSFGQFLEINLLGLSEISIPANLPAAVEPVAFAQLAIKATYAPAQGVFSLQAQLTSESYILSKSCKLTGGFALFVWFGGKHQGDFVITLGGYHPNYKKPAHYPDVPRLGFDWRLSSCIRVSGDIYFALTPSCLMAGGRLSAVFEASPIKAWFIAKADFFIGWKPFSYDISLYVSIGVEVKINLLFIKTTLRLEISAGLHIWGPDFQGTAHITIFIISFTISFGKKGTPVATAIQWYEFRDSFLPQAEPSTRSLQTNNSSAVPLALSVTSGLRGEVKSGTAACYVVSADGLELLVHSAVPSTKLELNGAVQKKLREQMPSLGVLPMGEDSGLTSRMEVTVSGSYGAVSCTAQVEYENLPRSLWGLTKSGSELVEGAAMGLRITPSLTDFPYFPAQGCIDLDKLSENSKIHREFYWNPIWCLPQEPQTDPIGTFSRTAAKEDVCTERAKCVAAWAALGYPIPAATGLSILAKEAENWFSEEMLLARLV